MEGSPNHGKGQHSGSVSLQPVTMQYDSLEDEGRQVFSPQN